MPTTSKECRDLSGIETLLLCSDRKARRVSPLRFKEECNIRLVDLCECVNDPFGLLWLCVGLLQV
jgi:hypothetical protein